MRATHSILLFLLVCNLLFALTGQSAYAEWVPPAQRLKQNRADRQQEDQREDELPSKWLRGAKGYAKALEIQSQTQTDIFIYFVRPMTPDEKGLCKWFETRGVKSLPVRRLLRQYVKVRVPLPANPDNQDLAEKFFVNKTPAVYIVHPDGWRNRCTVFKWDEKPIKLLEPEEMVLLFRQNSSEKYQPPKEEEEETAE
jgi:hypothetical protein